MRTTAELREGFLTFFEERDHLRRKSASIIPPADDPTTLFIVAGMQPMKRWFLGEKSDAPRVTTVQKAVRAGGKQNDLDDVGLTNRHLCFLEMLGNFSFGDYFKDGAVDYAWEFVTEHMKLDPERVWASVFAGDPELGLGEDGVAIASWERYLPRERIVGLPRTENFWQAADTGPCGPSSEIYYDRGAEHGCGREDCRPGCECERYLELWNLVFMEFDLADDGALTPLPRQNIDTGMGLERGAMLMQGVESLFDTDTFKPLLDWVGERADAAYGSSEEATKAYRVIVEHARTSSFLVAEGVAPSNEGRGYVLRRVIRRAVQFGRRLGLEPPFLHELGDIVREQMGDVYPELVERRREISELVRGEEERFRETLERGEKLFEEMVAKGEITPDDAFRLHDTYGFPWELTKELAAERGLEVNEEEFTRLMEEQRERSRQASAFEVEVQVKGPRSDFVGYERTDVLTAILAYAELGDGTFQAKLEQSPFYPDGGGQVSDAGYIENEETGARADLISATRLEEDQVLTFQGDGFGEGMRVRAVVPWSVRFPTMANHTATHVLHTALRDVLGEHVRQAGSAVRPDKLRFDFTHPQALTPEERDRVEQEVNRVIFENRPVRAFITPIEEARRLEAMMLFGEKYGEEVRVVEIDGYSRELCGGTHVRSTAEIGPFVILSEGSVGSGARRIEAVTSGSAFGLLHERSLEAEELRSELAETRKQARKRGAERDRAADVVYRDESGDVVVAQVEAIKGSELRDLSDQIRQSKKAAAVLLGSVDDGRVYLVVNVDPSLVDAGVDAVAIAREAAKKIEGGGGGRPNLAEAGGKNPAGLDEAFEVGKSEIAAARG
ncbi:MAG TPA: alanine--tRNA ligase [Gaiellaceae bacterium]|nr:alanine--tRNA ligase [Gaiellaceae bacterium]